MGYHMEQYDYTAELITKWTSLGYLTGVKEPDLTKVAQRLEAAHRRSFGQRGDSGALDKELQQLRREGFFGKPRR